MLHITVPVPGLAGQTEGYARKNPRWKTTNARGYPYGAVVLHGKCRMLECEVKLMSKEGTCLPAREV